MNQVSGIGAQFSDYKNRIMNCGADLEEQACNVIATTEAPRAKLCIQAAGTAINAADAAFSWAKPVIKQDVDKLNALAAKFTYNN